MIIHLCDFCGTETTAGTDVRCQRLTIEPALTKRWKRSDHTESRFAHVVLKVGIDGINPDGDHVSSALCSKCQERILLGLLGHVNADMEADR